MSDSTPATGPQEPADGPAAAEAHPPAATAHRSAAPAPHGTPDEPAPPAAAGATREPAPAPLGVRREPTGDAGVDALLARLADVDHLAADGHLAVYEDVHRGLRDALTALDTHPGPLPGSHNHRS